ncbi:hypothetical protein B0H14DRAFT_2696966 [Mycena olivaceomarginata]|nr:hypothetical protein B0H14DRAFT_2696966 [Mycena olivaceomarginata]
MAFRSLVSLYTLVYALNLVQIALGAWIMHNFDRKETAEAQFMLMFVALYTLPMIYLLTGYQRRAEHRLSYVHENTNFLAFMVCFWSWSRLSLFENNSAVHYVQTFSPQPSSSYAPSRLARFALPAGSCAYAARPLY